jgi:CDP-glucose 4,6-dehydratase
MEKMDVSSPVISKDFWKNKKVFITGHTGFKGGWLSLWLQSLGANVKGYSLVPPTQPSLFEVAGVAANMQSEIGDIRNLEQLVKSVVEFAPDIIFHMAAQPIVRLSYSDPVQTYTTNVTGTVHMLEAARQCKGLKAFISVTSDKCYENKEWEWGYRETEPMGGFDPYSSSKACAELVTSAYRNSFFSAQGSAAIASARAGNVIGGGDWAMDRLIPDILKAFDRSEPVVARNPSSIRPWQHVLEPLSGYLLLAQYVYDHGTAYAEAWNFGPSEEDAKPVNWILDEMIKSFGENASWKVDTEQNNPHEAHYLKLDCSKARYRLGWQPTWDLQQTISRIVNWHQAWKRGDDMHAYCLREIKEYTL